MDYTIKDTGDGELRVNLGKFTIVNIFYKAERSLSPISQKNAMLLATDLLEILNGIAPVDDFSEEEIKQYSEGSDIEKKFEEFLELLKEI